MRRWAARAHLWGGLLTAPFLLVLGLSGSVLVWAPEIEHALEPRPVVATTARAAPSLDAVVAAALVAEPAAAPRALRMPPQAGQPFVVELAIGGHRLDAAVDGATLRVVDVRAPERSPLVAVRSLHAAFHGGRAGALVVGLLGLWLVAEGVSGLWLYGPSIARRVRGRSRIVHRVVGGGTLVVGTVVGLTGALLVVGALASVARSPVATERLRRLDFVTARVPAHDGRVVALVAEPAHRVRVEMRRADGAVHSLLVDADTGGRVAAAAPPERWDLVRRLHGGDFGWPLRVLYAAVGLALPVLSITGFLLSTRRFGERSRS